MKENKSINFPKDNNHEYLKEYNSDGKCIHCKDSDGFEYWLEYDSNGNMIHYKDSYGHEEWRKYDSNGYKESYSYDSYNDITHHKYSNGIECCHYGLCNITCTKDFDGKEYWTDKNGNLLE